MLLFSFFHLHYSNLLLPFEIEKTNGLSICFLVLFFSVNLHYKKDKNLPPLRLFQSYIFSTVEARDTFPN